MKFRTQKTTRDKEWCDIMIVQTTKKKIAIFNMYAPNKRKSKLMSKSDRIAWRNRQIHYMIRDFHTVSITGKSSRQKVSKDIDNLNLKSVVNRAL